MTLTNTERVHNHRITKGNDKAKKKYKALRGNYKIPSSQADKMKYWADSRITNWLINNGYVKFDFYSDVITNVK